MNYLFLPASSRKPGSIWANCFSGLFGGFGLAERGNNFQFFFGGILLQLYELRFNTQNLQFPQWRPHEESNLDIKLRKLAFYPLNYGDKTF